MFGPHSHALVTLHACTPYVTSASAGLSRSKHVTLADLIIMMKPTAKAAAAS
jgi:hypothetical protein